MSEYKIVAKPGVGEFVDKKSRFIAHVYAIDSEEQAQGYIEELKKKSEAGSVQDTYEGRLKKIESIIEDVVK